MRLRGKSHNTPTIAIFYGKTGEDASEFLNKKSVAFELDDVDEEEGLMVFRRYLAERALMWYKSLDKGVRQQFRKLIEAFEKNYINNNLVLKQQKYHRLNQNTKSVDSYIEDFEELIRHGGDKTDEAFKSRASSKTSTEYQEQSHGTYARDIRKGKRIGKTMRRIQITRK